jgi:phosphoribosyl-AMP cyclohydrolase
LIYVPWDICSRTMSGDEILEEGQTQQLDFNKLKSIGEAGHRVIPVVLQEIDTKEVLFIGYANQEAFELSLERKSAVLYSTSRHEIWHKGATSGDTLSLVEIRVNCEQNSLLYMVRRDGAGACHTKTESGVGRSGCYYRKVDNSETLSFL